ncbi:hypothetical protein RJ641_004819 [Dillenia turbinata]|uniref:AIPP2-like SPOC-like domain-containing protein n=1 Tax=Dillenia turbinata TaxID=194707 RepID=A0AAN8VAR4_9MAGN
MDKDEVPDSESRCMSPKLQHGSPTSSESISFGNSGKTHPLVIFCAVYDGSTIVYLGGTHGRGVGPNNDEVQDENNPSIGPAKMFIWKGNFYIGNITPESHLCRSCDGFIAHPAAVISRRALDFSKQLSEVIQLKLYPRSHCDLWPKEFRSDPPDWSHIALFFYPGHEERSKKKYGVLLKFMEENNLVLRSLIGRVELLICPSHLFPLDYQTLNGSFFMWGVFRSLEGSSTTSTAHDSQKPERKTRETARYYKRKRQT